MAKRKTSRKTKAVRRRTPKRLSHTLYSYVEPINGRYARSYGKRNFGSFSNYVDVLIAADRKLDFASKWAKTLLEKATRAKNTKRKTRATKKTSAKIIPIRRKKVASKPATVPTTQAA